MATKLEPMCACGCGEPTKGGTFCPGHDAKLLSAIYAHIGAREGSQVLDLARFVETMTGSRVVPGYCEWRTDP